jgi:hypothetical protein
MPHNASENTSGIGLSGRLAGAAAWLATACLLGACAVGPDGAAMLAPAAETQQADSASALEARYCYRSLADVDCYTEVLRDTRRSRVGYFHEFAE